MFLKEYCILFELKFEHVGPRLSYRSMGWFLYEDTAEVD